MSLKWRDKDLEATDTRLVEAVVGPSSLLAGRSLAESHLRENYGAVVLAVRQHGALTYGEFQNITLMPGDTLLIDVPNNRIEHLTQQRVFLLVSRAGIPRFNWSKAIKAITILVSVVARTRAQPEKSPRFRGVLAVKTSRESRDANCESCS